MKLYACTIIICLASLGWCAEDLRFPEGFLFGAASAAYQIEGGWNASDKSESIWDVFVHKNPSPISDNSTGDIACNSYELWRKDVQIAKDLGLHFYRFSLSWTRILPTGFPDRISKDGVAYYNNLINALLAEGIEPMVTIYHWDLPQRLQEMGGWTNPLIAEWASDYARVVYQLFGDRVKHWITINEPIIICFTGYGSTLFAPGMNDFKVASNLCAKHTILAHAKMYRLYEKEFKERFHGKVSFSHHFVWYEPLLPEYRELTEAMKQHSMGLFTHPVYSREGGWPKVVVDKLDNSSRLEGYPRSRLPAFTDEEIQFVKGTYDFLGLNHYTSKMVRPTEPGDSFTDYPYFGNDELNVTCVSNPNWPSTSSFWFEVHPEGLREILKWIKNEFGDVEVIITENGYSSNGTLNDTDRIMYIKENLKQILLAIREDGINVSGYTAWSLTDNFEWVDGYGSKFGIYEVDFKSTFRTRTARKSAEFYKKVIAAHSLDVA